jgi:hypothetical protein
MDQGQSESLDGLIQSGRVDFFRAIQQFMNDSLCRLGEFVRLMQEGLSLFMFRHARRAMTHNLPP